jgi:hypothetical protein
MAKWLLMLLNDGKDTQGHRVLRSGVMDDVFHPANVLLGSSNAAENYERPVTPESFSGDLYCLGWRKGYYRGKGREGEDGEGAQVFIRSVCGGVGVG